jgi:hypothetical protein
LRDNNVVDGMKEGLEFALAYSSRSLFFEKLGEKEGLESCARPLE